MIDNRPAYLVEHLDYEVIPALPIGLDLGTVPDWIKRSMLFLGGVQPVTGEMAAAADFLLEDRPSAGELELFRSKGTRFQTISVVTSIAAFREKDGVQLGIPYAISLLPANKRGQVLSEVGADFVERIDLNTVMQSQEPCYSQFNPFTGDWGLWGPISIILGDKPKRAFPDTLGIVTDMYFLQLGFDPNDLLVVNTGLDDGKPLQKYLRHRTKLMFSQFENFKARRVWGSESPIELFLLQGLLREGLTPNLQMLIFEDGSTYPSLYDFWAENLDELPGLISEADLYFPDQRVAVFCDSTRHHRGSKSIRKDANINSRLDAAGINWVRVPGKLIVHDFRTAIDLVLNALR